jgi:hypothetical protein
MVGETTTLFDGAVSTDGYEHNAVQGSMLALSSSNGFQVQRFDSFSDFERGTLNVELRNRIFALQFHPSSSRFRLSRQPGLLLFCLRSIFGGNHVT